MEVTTKKQNRRKIVIGVLIAVVVLVAALIAFASSYLVNYAIGRSGDGGDREVALDVEAPTVGVEQLIAENSAVQKQANEEFLQQNPGQTVQITAADGLRLNGVYYPNAGSHLWVIALHGYRGSHTGATNLAQHYYDAGYQVLTPDLRACGDSEGDYVGMGWLDRKDVLQWIDWVLAQDSEAEIVLHGVSMDCPHGAFTAIVGESGCGKSTVASVLTGRCRGYTGSAALSGGEISALSADSLLRTVTYVGFSSYLFRGTVAENLRMARPDADDASLWDVLERVRLAGFLRGERGLDTPLDAQGANLSGGQRQRLALARALLHDSPVYVFDEATSNIDVESENDIMAEIRALARRRTVIVITHRLANVTDADSIYVLEGGTVAGHGPHAALLAQGGLYKTLWDRQQELEHFGTEEVSA